MLKRASFLAIFVFLLSLIPASFALASEGKVSFLLGEVTINGVQATRGATVSSGDEIVASKKGSALIVMRDKSTLHVKRGSSIKIKDYKFDAEQPEKSRSVITLITGTLRYISGLINKQSPGRAKIQTAVATLGIRGTDAEITYRREDGTIAAQFNRGTGVLTVFSSDGVTPVASVPIPTGQAGQGQAGSGNVAVEPATPDQVTAAVNSAGRGNANAESIKNATKELDPVGKLVTIAILNTQDDIPTSEAISGVLGNSTGDSVVADAGLTLSVANALEPESAGENTANAVSTVSAATNGDANAMSETLAASVETVKDNVEAVKNVVNEGVKTVAAETDGDQNALTQAVSASVKVIASEGKEVVTETVGAAIAASAEATGDSNIIKEVVIASTNTLSEDGVTLDANDFAAIATAAGEELGSDAANTAEALDAVVEGVTEGAEDTGVEVDQNQINDAAETGAQEGQQQAQQEQSPEGLETALGEEEGEAAEEDTTEDEAQVENEADSTTVTTDLLGSSGGSN